MLTLSPDIATPLVSQIVDGLRGLIAGQVLKPGSKLPSIRAFAVTHNVSVFTVVEAYDRLVAQGWLVSRAHSGFFVKRREEGGSIGCTGSRSAETPRFDASWVPQADFRESQFAAQSPAAAGCRTTGCLAMRCAAACASSPAMAPKWMVMACLTATWPCA